MKHTIQYRKDSDVGAPEAETATETAEAPVAETTETPDSGPNADYQAGYDAGVADGRAQAQEETSKRIKESSESVRGILTLLRDDPDSPATANERLFLDKALKQLDEVPA